MKSYVSQVNRFWVVVPPGRLDVLHSLQASLKVVSQKNGGLYIHKLLFLEPSEKNQQNKQFRWTDKMVSQLIECLAAYKSRMEYQNKDFNADKPVQYKEIRR